MIMVLAPGYILANTAPGERGRTGGIIYTGVGTGIALSSVLVPPLAGQNIAWAWAGLAIAACIATVATWPIWRNRAPAPIPAGHDLKARMPLPVWLLIIPYGLDAVGVVPHMLFWVDYITRELGRGTAAGALQWLLFGLGGVAGPMLAGKIGDRIGLGTGIVAAFALKAFLVALPAYFTGTIWLSLSSLAVGGISPGIAALSAGRLGELLPLHLQSRALGRATLSYGIFQAIIAYALSYLYGLFGSYVWLFVIGGVGEFVCAGFALASYWVARERAPRQPIL
jgi:predicted MFS family arabinose efflux permease